MAAGWASDWLAQQNKKIKLSPAELCPCGSGWVIASCCLDPSDGTLRKKVPSIVPPGPKTHFAHAGCYLRDTNNCSPDISREHYVSAHVLEQIAASMEKVIDAFEGKWEERAGLYFNGDAGTLLTTAFHVQ